MTDGTKMNHANRAIDALLKAHESLRELAHADAELEPTRAELGALIDRVAGALYARVVRGR